MAMHTDPRLCVQTPSPERKQALFRAINANRGLRAFPYLTGQQRSTKAAIYSYARAHSLRVVERPQGLGLVGARESTPAVLSTIPLHNTGGRLQTCLHRLHTMATQRAMRGPPPPPPAFAPGPPHGPPRGHPPGPPPRPHPRYPRAPARAPYHEPHRQPEVSTTVPPPPPGFPPRAIPIQLPPTPQGAAVIPPLRVEWDTVGKKWTLI